LRSHILSLFLRPNFFIRRSKSRFRRLILFTLKLNLFGPDIRAADSYISPLRAWGIQNDLQGTELFLPSQIFEKVKNLIPPGQRWLAMAPATAWPKKNWPFEYWKNLIQTMISTTQFNILLLGGPNDGFCKDLVINPKRILNLQ